MGCGIWQECGGKLFFAPLYMDGFEGRVWTMSYPFSVCCWVFDLLVHWKGESLAFLPFRGMWIMKHEKAPSPINILSFGISP